MSCNDGDGGAQQLGDGNFGGLGQRNDVAEARLVGLPLVVGREEGGQHKLDSVGGRTVMMASRAAWASTATLMILSPSRLRRGSTRSVRKAFRPGTRAETIW
jgi:hypothetical protein